MARKSDSTQPSPSFGPIADRVRGRLEAAGHAFDRRERASRPKRHRPGLSLVPSSDSDTVRRRETACLRSVFRELGDAHRRYRSQSGQGGTPALRAAAHAFKEAPSVAALVSVAEHLDELGILAW
jgi:hypothetical protein